MSNRFIDGDQTTQIGCLEMSAPLKSGNVQRAIEKRCEGCFQSVEKEAVVADIPAACFSRLICVLPSLEKFWLGRSDALLDHDQLLPLESCAACSGTCGSRARLSIRRSHSNNFRNLKCVVVAQQPRQATTNSTNRFGEKTKSDRRPVENLVQFPLVV